MKTVHLLYYLDLREGKILLDIYHKKTDAIKQKRREVAAADNAFVGLGKAKDYEIKSWIVS